MCVLRESLKISRLTRLRLLHYPKTYGMSRASSVKSRMSRIKHLAAYMFRTLMVGNVSLTRKSKIPRLTRLRLLHYPKTYGMSCASSVEIDDVSHKAPCRIHVPNSYGLTRKSKTSRLTRLRFLHYRRLTVCRVHLP